MATKKNDKTVKNIANLPQKNLFSFFILIPDSSISNLDTLTPLNMYALLNANVTGL